MVVIVIGLRSTVAAKVGASSLFDIFRLAKDIYPGIGRFPGRQPDAGLSSVWLMTSALNLALGTWILPHIFQLCYAADSAGSVSRNAIWQPLYLLSYLLIIALGFAALMAGARPPGGDSNAVLLTFVTDAYSAWATGLVAGTACLLALVPGAFLLLTASTILRNVALPLRPGLPDAGALRLSRLAKVAFAGTASYLAVGASRSLVEIGLCPKRRSACWRREYSSPFCGRAPTPRASWPASSPVMRRCYCRQPTASGRPLASPPNGGPISPPGRRFPAPPNVGGRPVPVVGRSRRDGAGRCRR